LDEQDNQNDNVEEKMSKSLFLTLFLYDQKYQTKLKPTGKILIGTFLQEYKNCTMGSLSFEEFLRGCMLLESDDVKDQIKLIFRLVNMKNRDKIKKTDIEKFLKTLQKTGNLTALKNRESEEPSEEIPIEDFSFDQNGFISEDEVIEEMFKNDSYTKFISCFKSEHATNEFKLAAIVDKIMKLNLWFKRNKLLATRLG